MAYTIKELDAAIREVFPKHWFAIKDHGRVLVHQNACAKAFIEQIEGETADILREAYRDLEKTGSYQPSDGVFPHDP